MVPKGFRPAVLPVSFLPRSTSAGTLLPALASLHGFNGQHISLLFGKFAFNYETEDDWKRGWCTSMFLLKLTSFGRICL